MGRRVAVVADIHGNLTALEAVIADLGEMKPAVVMHGGDLADAGASPGAVIDRVRELGWRGVMGNADEMLYRPASLTEFAAPHPHLAPMFAKVAEMAAWTRAQLGPDRLEWLRAQPATEHGEGLALVHASPGDPWRAPRQDADDDTLRATYGALSRPVVVYGHTHVPFIRTLGDLTVANSGSAGQPHDGDSRASYLMIDGGYVVTRRVAYDQGKEISRLRRSGLPTQSGSSARSSAPARRRHSPATGMAFPADRPSCRGNRCPRSSIEPEVRTKLVKVRLGPPTHPPTPAG